MNSLPILSILIVLPAISGILLLMISYMYSKRVVSLAKYFTMFICIVELFFIGILIKNFSFTHWIQFMEEYEWINFGEFKINVFFGIDGISLSFIVLTAILIPICILTSWHNIQTKVILYCSLLLFTESILMGFFSSLNIIIFYIFFEIILIPMIFIIGLWGGKNKINAIYKFFLYTFSGSILMLISIVYISIQNCNPVDSITNCEGCMSDILVLTSFIHEQHWQTQSWVWWFIFIGLAVKVPIWPLHSWLPYAHVQAPTSGSMILAGILLKMGGYGMLRLLIDLFPRLSAEFANIVIIISIISIIYASCIALVQKDMKKLIAYSSISHMGYVIISMFSGSALGINGAIIQMLSHGVVSSALFFIIGALYDRTHTKKISKYSGIAKTMPNLSIFFMLHTLSAIGLPGTSGFIGEFIAILSVFNKNFVYGIITCSGMVLGALYMLQLYNKVVFHHTNNLCTSLSDLSYREYFILLVLTIIMLIIGLYSKIVIQYITESLEFFGQFYEYNLKSNFYVR